MESTDSLSLDELAGVFRVTEKAVRGWIAAGMPVLTQGKQGRGNRTSISLREAVEWYFAENYERLELDRARTRLADEQSRKVALENEVRTGDFGELSVWQRELEKFLGELRAAFLAFPIKLAPLLDGDVNRRKDTLESAVHELLETLGAYDGDGKGLPAQDPGVGDRSSAPAKAKRQRVGGRKKKAVQRKQRRARKVEDEPGGISARDHGRDQRSTDSGSVVSEERTDRLDGDPQ